MCKGPTGPTRLDLRFCGPTERPTRSYAGRTGRTGGRTVVLRSELRKYPVGPPFLISTLGAAVPDSVRRPRRSSREVLGAVRAIVSPTITADPRLAGAACRGLAPWFDADVPGESETGRADRQAAAARVCRRCPVRADCTIVAAELGRSVTGVWAGQVFGPAGGVRPAVPPDDAP